MTAARPAGRLRRRVPARLGWLLLAAVATDVTLWSHYVAWAQEVGAAASIPQQLEVYDLDTGTTATPVQVSGHDEVALPHGDGDLVAYTVADVTNEDAVTWRIRTTDLRRHVTVDIIQGRFPVSLILLPIPVVKLPYLVWVEPLQADSLEAQVIVYNVETHSRRVITAKQPHTVSVDGAWLFFDATSDAPGKRDAFAARLDSASSAPRRLTHSGRVAYPWASNGVLAWQEPIAGDPDSIWGERDDDPSATPVEITAGRNQGNAVPGQGFVVWLNGQLALRPLDSVTPRTMLPDQHPNIPLRWAALGHTVAWASGQATPQDPLVIYLAQVGG